MFLLKQTCHPVYDDIKRAKRVESKPSAKLPGTWIPPFESYTMA
ncbi:MAG: hypothetical protein ACLPY1_23935 [Terracidiphilus sp.]